MHPQDLLRQLDEWEEPLRGYSMFPSRVSLEPVFVPLLAQARTRSKIVDDARKPGIWERLIGRGQRTSDPDFDEPPVDATEPDPGEIVEIELRAPIDFSVKGQAVRQCLMTLRSCRHPIAFELLGSDQAVSAQLSCSERDRETIVGTLAAYFPEIKTRRRNEALLGVMSDASYAAVFELGLRERVFRSLRIDEKLDVDPLIAIVARLSELGKMERAVVQVLFQRAVAPWGQEFVDLASNIDDVDRVLPLIKSKFAEPMYAVVIRAGAFAPDADEAAERAFGIAGALMSATRSDENELCFLEQPADLSVEAELFDMFERRSHRAGMILSLSELQTLVHPPSASVRSSRLVRQSGKTKAPPQVAVDQPIVLGINEHDGEQTVVSLSPEQRSRHVYVIGASGTGKSTLLVSMAAQDAAIGNGFAVLDPHGDLVEDILARIPENRAKDVILFDPADEEYPVGFNILSAHSELERTLLASDLVSVFKRLSTSFGDVMVSVLGNAVLAFLESSEGGTLLDLRNFLVDEASRATVLRKVTDREVVNYWTREFPLLRGFPHAPVLTRLNTFLRTKLIRRMVAQRNDRVDFRRIMDRKVIFLAKLSHGAIGEENAHLLGSLLVSKIAQAAMSRQNIEASRREPYALYIDEFHHFITPSIATILSGARKYGLGLVLAHQEMRQLKSRSEDVASAVLANAATRVVFRVGEHDAKALAEGFSFFEAKDLQSLGLGQAVARIERADWDFNLATTLPPVVDSSVADSRRAAVLAESRAQYATPRAQVDALLDALHDAVQDLSSEQRETGRRQPRPAKAARAPSTDDVLPGRGGPQHKYLQSLIRRLAEGRGFTASLEVPVLEGHGHVDVLVAGHGVSVAVEISVTTGIEHEVGNLTKCLAAGFQYAVLISSDERTRDLARAEMSGADRRRVRIVSPGEFGDVLDSFVTSSGESPAVKSQPPSAVTASSKEGGLLQTEDAATYLRLAVQTLAKMRVTGESPPFHKIGRRVMYDRKDLDEWLAVRKRRSTSDDGTQPT